MKRRSFVAKATLGIIGVHSVLSCKEIEKEEPIDKEVVVKELPVDNAPSRLEVQSILLLKSPSCWSKEEPTKATGSPCINSEPCSGECIVIDGGRLLEKERTVI